MFGKKKIQEELRAIRREIYKLKYVKTGRSDFRMKIPLNEMFEDREPGKEYKKVNEACEELYQMIERGGKKCN